MRAALAAICGQPNWVPWLNVSGNVAHYEADRGITTSGGSNVSSWVDVNGRGLSLTPHPSGGPTHANDDGDGKPAVVFSGSSQMLRNLTWNRFDPDSDHTVLLILKRTGTTDGIPWSYGDPGSGNGRLMYRQFAGSPPASFEFEYLSNTGGGTAITNVHPGQVWTMTVMRRSGSTRYIQFDGGSELSGAIPAGAFNMQDIYLGAGASSGSIVLPWPGKYRAFSAFNRSLSSTEIAKIRAWWKSHWPGLP